MREIVFDTETTGLDAEGADRLCEIGAVELERHVPTGRTFHAYVNPGRPMPPEAEAVHGLSDSFLRDKPPFAAVAPEFLAFVGGATLIAHNAGFDVGFLNAELGRVGLPPLASEVIDTRALAKRRFPGAPASLDALCRRFGVDNSGRTLHGALLDSQLLAEVYLELVGGRQPDFALAAAARDEGPRAAAGRVGARPRPLAPRITEREAAAHRAFVEALGPKALWLR